MQTSRSRWCAGALVAVLAATFLLPVSALAKVSALSARKHGCNCPVKMACCESGLCHGDTDPGPSSGPSWSGCRDEAPERAALAAPSTAFDGALLAESDSRPGEAGALVPLVAPIGAGAPGPAPATPPPRPSIETC